MNLLRIILILLAVWIAYRIISGYLMQQNRAAGNRPAKIGTMVACQYCGLHIPETEAIRVVRNGAEDRFFCSSDHRKLFEAGTSMEE